MARYRITVKISARSAGMVIEPGMSIEIASMEFLFYHTLASILPHFGK